MASNHTKASAITERIAADFFWENGYKNKYKSMPKKVFLDMTEDGDLSLSNVLENFIILINPKKKRTNDAGMDFTDKSDAKYMSTRIKVVTTKHKKKDGTVSVYKSKMLNCRLSGQSLRKKTGTLRIAITVYNPEDTSISKVLLIRIPYPQWNNCTHKDGGLNFEFNMNGTLKDSYAKKFDKYICDDVNEFCK
jgi:hypothetical protein